MDRQADAGRASIANETGVDCSRYKIISSNIFRPDILQTIKDTVDELSPSLRKLSLDIHDHPETMFEEVYAHDTLTTFMEDRGFSVTRHYLDLKTAFRAEFSFKEKSPGRVIGVNSEMDALPGIGHACGHNLIAVAGVGVALALKVALIKHELPGKIVLLGTPAEEGGNGKGILIDRGGYEDMDVCMMCHPGPGQDNYTSVATTLAMDAINLEYFGHTAHAAMAPWEGQNALDAAYLAYTGVSMMRQQMKPDQRVHGVVYGRDWAANIIPDYSRMRYYVRAPTWKEVEVLRERVMNCFKAAAKATSCKAKMETEAGTRELRQNSVLAEEYLKVAEEGIGMGVLMSEEARASTDFGNVTYYLPSLHPGFAIPTEPNGGNHTPAFTAAAATPEAHKAAMSTTKALAHTAVRVLLDDEFFDKVKEAFVPA